MGWNVIGKSEPKEPLNPLAGCRGLLVDLLQSLSDADLSEYCLYWSWRRDQSGYEFSRWKCSNILSAGFREANSRGVDPIV